MTSASSRNSLSSLRVSAHCLSVLDNDDGSLQDDGEDDEILLPFDERDQDKQTNNVVSKKNKLPFSFLMHHYLKATNGNEELQ